MATNYDDLFQPDPKVTGFGVTKPTSNSPKTGMGAPSAANSSSPLPDVSGIVQQIAQQVLDQLKPWIEQHYSPPTPPPDDSFGKAAIPVTDLPEFHALQGQIDILQLRQEKQEQQLANYEAEIAELLREKELLEQIIQELPEIYRQKFIQRIQPIQERIRQIQQENRQLRVDLHDLSLQLHHHQSWEVLDSPRWQVRLPQLPKMNRRPLPALPRASSQP
ncbi:MAG: hypothetical protein NW237_16475 [Cyanobacteriota bacterium]|nr:hypothetical protein [Cyanobacteriota bacterium]